MKEEVKESDGFESIFMRWEAASKMRQWSNEFKKYLIEKINKAIETESPAANEEEKLRIADERFEHQLKETYNKIVEKTEFLIKLSVPDVFLIQDESQIKASNMLKQLISNQTGLNPSASDEWKDRRASLRLMLTKSNSLTFAQKKKHIFESAIMSILACLQTPIDIEKMKQRVEKIHLQARKRICGLKILAQVLTYEHLPVNHLYDAASWFLVGLRNDQAQQSHYLDGLKGCGHNLEDQARLYFFAIIKGLLKRLNSITLERDAKLVLNCLKWNYVSKDHEALNYIHIFRHLHVGASDKPTDTNLIKNAWGKFIGEGASKDRSFPLEVLGQFEDTFYTILARLCRPDGVPEVVKKSTSQLTIQKAHSFKEENVSEQLLHQALNVIKEELERYVKAASECKGIEWNTLLRISATGEEFDSEDEEAKDEEGVHRSETAKEIKRIKSIPSQTFLRKLLSILEVLSSISTVSMDSFLSSI